MHSSKVISKDKFKTLPNFHFGKLGNCKVNLFDQCTAVQCVYVFIRAYFGLLSTLLAGGKCAHNSFSLYFQNNLII